MNTSNTPHRLALAQLEESMKNDPFNPTNPNRPNQHDALIKLAVLHARGGITHVNPQSRNDYQQQNQQRRTQQQQQQQSQGSQQGGYQQQQQQPQPQSYSSASQQQGQGQTAPGVHPGRAINNGPSNFDSFDQPQRGGDRRAGNRYGNSDSSSGGSRYL